MLITIKGLIIANELILKQVRLVVELEAITIAVGEN